MFFFLRTYLGFPYTRCIETKATNNYTYDEQGRQIYDIGENPYKESLCIFQALMEVENLPIFLVFFNFNSQKIERTCGCLPDYIEGVRREHNSSNMLKSCNFFEHTTCVSILVDGFQWSEEKCLPACSRKYFNDIKRGSLEFQNPICSEIFKTLLGALLFIFFKIVRNLC